MVGVMVRMRRTSPAGRAAVFVAALLAATSCGDPGQESPAAAGPEATAFLLTADDMPGFVTLPRPSNWPPVYAECGGEDTLLPGGSSGGHGVITFYRDDTARLRKLQVDGVESYAVLAETDADAQRTMDVVADPAFQRCMQDGLAVAEEETVENEQVVGSSTIDLETPAVADEVVAFRVTVDEAEHHFDHELTAIRKGRALAFLFTGRLGSDSYPDSERQRLAEAIASRMP